MEYAISDGALLRRAAGATLSEIELYTPGRGWGPYGVESRDIRHSSIAAWVEARRCDEAEAGSFVAALMEKGYNPNQPRHPAGSPQGGEWSGGNIFGGPDNSPFTDRTPAEDLGMTPLGWQDRYPPSSEDPAPGGKWEYHSTKADSLSSIADSGLKASAASGLSTTPHLEGAHFYGDLVDDSARGGPAKQAVLLRMSREGLKVGYPDQDGTVRNKPTPKFDKDPTREHLVLQDVPAEKLEFYYKGEWRPVSSANTPDSSWRKGYNPQQPRHPAGSEHGGQWMGGGTGDAWADSAGAAISEYQQDAPAAPEESSKPGKRRILADTAHVSHALAIMHIADAEIDGKDKLFNRPPGTFDAPIEQLENIRARPEGISNAARLMYAGLIGHPDAKPRDPISVQQAEDGKYRIYDGNSTYAILREAGWSTAPVRLVDDAGNPVTA